MIAKNVLCLRTQIKLDHKPEGPQKYFHFRGLCISVCSSAIPFVILMEAESEKNMWGPLEKICDGGGSINKNV